MFGANLMIPAQICDELLYGQGKQGSHDPGFPGKVLTFQNNISRPWKSPWMCKISKTPGIYQTINLMLSLMSTNLASWTWLTVQRSSPKAIYFNLRVFHLVAQIELRNSLVRVMLYSAVHLACQLSRDGCGSAVKCIESYNGLATRVSLAAELTSNWHRAKFGDLTTDFRRVLNICEGVSSVFFLIVVPYAIKYERTLIPQALGYRFTWRRRMRHECDVWDDHFSFQNRNWCTFTHVYNKRWQEMLKCEL